MTKFKFLIWLAALASGVAGTATAQQVPAMPVPAAAELIAVQYTTLKPPGCSTTNKTPPGRIGEHEVVRWHCPAPGKRIVRLDYHGVYVTLALSDGSGGAGQETAGEGLVSASYDIGPRMEWRGSGKGKDFMPHAAIVRLHARNDAGIVVSVLAVLQLAGEKFCVLAIAEGVHANAMARARADRFARSPQAAPVCPSSPELLGPGRPVARAMQAANSRKQLQFLQEFNARKTQER